MPSQQIISFKQNANRWKIYYDTTGLLLVITALETKNIGLRFDFSFLVCHTTRGVPYANVIFNCTHFFEMQN